MLILSIRTGSEIPQTFKLSKSKTTVGRSAEADLTVDDNKLSRVHVTIECSSQGITVTDNQSRNGTFSGDMQLDAQKPATLLVGDSFRMGTTVVEVVDFLSPPSVELATQIDFSEELVQETHLTTQLLELTEDLTGCSLESAAGKKVLNRTASFISEYLQCSGLVMVQRNSEENESVIVSSGTGASWQVDHIPIEDVWLNEAFKTGKALVVDPRNDRLFSSDAMSQLSEKSGIELAVLIPIKSRVRVLGFVYAEKNSNLEFDSRGVAKAHVLCHWLYNALETERLLRNSTQESAQLKQQNSQLQKLSTGRVQFGALTTTSPIMAETLEQATRVAPTHVPVHITGETGTGKELLAQTIHLQSGRSQKSFIAFNCGAVSESILEAELFGYMKGAFTGADSDHHGLIQKAHGGTLFLDEIGDVSAKLQVSLLRFLQEGTIRPVGGTSDITVDVRVISATHRDLSEEVAAGSFREDLLYRLKVFSVMLPALRHRMADFEQLVDSIKERHALSMPAISGDAFESLMSYAWPGNIRELENELRRLAIIAIDADEVLKTHLSPHISEKKAPTESVVDGVRRFGGLKGAIEEYERQIIRTVLTEEDGNKSTAAKVLGLSRSYLFQKMKRLGMDS